MNWNKIDSAPKDGSSILCFCEDYQIVCYWNDYDDERYWNGHELGIKKGWNDFHYETHNPMFWMPLPEPPKEKYELD